MKNLLAAHSSLEATTDEIKEWTTTADPLWNQFRPLAEINAQLDTKTEKVSIMIVQDNEVVQFFNFLLEEQLDSFFDYLETYSESLV